MHTEIDSFINDFNKCWTRGKLEEISSLLHEDVVFVAPDLETQIKGRAACIKTLEEYDKTANTLDFKVTGREIHRWQDTAAVSLDYKIEYELGEKTYREKGKEFWTLVNKNEAWQMLWRVMVKSEQMD